MSKFFIDRPIFAWVIALVLMLAGTLAVLNLPVNQYPSIAPPNVSISVNYPGASARTVQDTVVQVIEQQLNGLAWPPRDLRRTSCANLIWQLLRRASCITPPHANINC